MGKQCEEVKASNVPWGCVIEGIELFAGEFVLVARPHFTTGEIGQDAPVPLAQEEIWHCR
jgi:hypothetical protein